MILGTPGRRSTRWLSRVSTAPTFTNAPNAGVIFAASEPFEERVLKGSAQAILATCASNSAQLNDALVFVLEPPSVPGIGTGGGFKVQ